MALASLRMTSDLGGAPGSFVMAARSARPFVVQRP